MNHPSRRKFLGSAAGLGFSMGLTETTAQNAQAEAVSTLLLRNLHDVFGEINPVRRRAAIDEIFHEDAVFYEPNGNHRGREEIDRISGVIKATHPNFQYQPLSPPEVTGDLAAHNSPKSSLSFRSHFFKKSMRG